MDNQILKDLLLNLEPDKIIIIPAYCNNLRINLHRYIESLNIENLFKTSFKCNKYKLDCETMKICEECNKLIKMNYNNGILKNNKDEYYVGFCNNCNLNFNYEPNYDDKNGIINIDRNNVILIGFYFRGYKIKSSDNIDIDFYFNINNIISEIKIIECPNKNLNKRKLKLYIEQQLLDI